ncbi:MAG: DNA-binding protein [Haloferacaceae archaeon]
MSDTPTRPAPDPAVEVSPDRPPAARCPYCDRPFRTERAWALHLGEVHPGACTDEEAAAHERARAAERDDLFYFHLKAIAALGSVYALTVVLYMVALGSGII